MHDYEREYLTAASNNRKVEAQTCNFHLLKLSETASQCRLNVIWWMILICFLFFFVTKSEFKYIFFNKFLWDNLKGLVTMPNTNLNFPIQQSTQLSSAQLMLLVNLSFIYCNLIYLSIPSFSLVRINIHAEVIEIAMLPSSSSSKSFFRL